MFEQLMKQNEAMMKQFQTMMGADALAQMMKPYTNLLEMQRSVIESITEEQTRVATELMNDYLEEARQVCSCNSLPEAVEIQKAYLAKVQERMAVLAKKQAESFTKLGEESIQVMKHSAEDLMKNMQTK
ncbi:MAG: TIGR01841 family phasin [Litorivicinaceae bacterium]|nr:TIGR01841 family phasin [Litorivicinaceae bacterium]MDP5328802.1 TIGR01841 family phasin [Litorivicinaceae bacterium]MDP5330082.1 TIGR01841 family phasin [Litorivicinaceae bacterium]MDP5341273.1 TIGR01841 family phasin [Litorivicinaceae bacterium]MDP5341653.1 TIGR01841 family phasin [Litorivicinaceae bacterium]